MGIISGMSMRRSTKRGALLLDKMIPGWHRRVNLERLTMSSLSLCMLGQLFGQQAETAIAKEMFPEEWQATADSVQGRSGYSIGLRMIRQWVTGKGKQEREEHDFLDRACSGYDTKCYWAEEVAERIAAEEETHV